MNTIERHVIEEIVDAIVLKALTKVGEEDLFDNNSPANWETHDCITFGMWRDSIREVLEGLVK